jgi:hypothetical protein
VGIDAILTYAKLQAEHQVWCALHGAPVLATTCLRYERRVILQVVTLRIISERALQQRIVETTPRCSCRFNASTVFEPGHSRPHMARRAIKAIRYAAVLLTFVATTYLGGRLALNRIARWRSLCDTSS